VFDLGGVLIDVRMACCVSPWSRSLGMDPEEMVALLWRDRTYERLERGEITVERYVRKVSEVLGGRALSMEEFLAGWNGVFFGLMEGAVGLLDALGRRGLRLVGLTNTNEAHTRFWSGRYPQIGQRLERIFLSHDLGSRKPESACYRAVLDYLGLPAGAVAFVDDRPENTAAAERLGMRPVLAEGTDSIVRGLRGLGLDDLDQI
jgi:putative hydrolase of the HAD superfamily